MYNLKTIVKYFLFGRVIAKRVYLSEFGTPFENIRKKAREDALNILGEGNTGLTDEKCPLTGQERQAVFAGVDLYLCSVGGTGDVLSWQSLLHLDVNGKIQPVGSLYHSILGAFASDVTTTSYLYLVEGEEGEVRLFVADWLPDYKNHSLARNCTGNVTFCDAAYSKPEPSIPAFKAEADKEYPSSATIMDVCHVGYRKRGRDKLYYWQGDFYILHATSPNVLFLKLRMNTEKGKFEADKGLHKLDYFSVLKSTDEYFGEAVSYPTREFSLAVNPFPFRMRRYETYSLKNAKGEEISKLGYFENNESLPGNYGRLVYGWNTYYLMLHGGETSCMLRPLDVKPDGEGGVYFVETNSPRIDADTREVFEKSRECLLYDSVYNCKDVKILCVCPWYGTVLAMSHEGSDRNMRLIGGRVGQDEKPGEAAKRIFEEVTGITLGDNLRQVFAGVNPEHLGRGTTVFTLAHRDALDVSNRIKKSLEKQLKGCRIKMVGFSELLKHDAASNGIISLVLRSYVRSVQLGR